MARNEELALMLDNSNKKKKKTIWCCNPKLKLQQPYVSRPTKIATIWVVTTFDVITNKMGQDNHTCRNQ